MKKIKFPIISNDDDECERIFGIIKFVVFVIAVCLLILAVLKLCHWICPVLAWGFISGTSANTKSDVSAMS